MTSMMLNIQEAQLRQRQIAAESNSTRETANGAKPQAGVTSAITGLIRRAARPGKSAPAEGRPALA
jgi:hypothetical protein